MTATFAQVVDALKAQIESLDIRVYAGFVESPDPPCIIIVPKAPIELGATFEGTLQYDVSLICLTLANVMDGSQRKMLDWLSSGTATSVVDLLNGSTLNGVVSSATAQTIGRYGLDAQPSNARFVTAELVVEIIT